MFEKVEANDYILAGNYELLATISTAENAPFPDLRYLSVP
jgi:hypothetical protein